MIKFLLIWSAMAVSAIADNSTTVAPDTQVPLIFSGGHDTYPPDHGRPVVLIAAALQVKPEVFREAFSRVHPAPMGQAPEPEQVRRNKEALMKALEPLGVTDDRLNEVSNHYRYRRGLGEMWPTVEASGFATVLNGKVTGYTITNPGSGYSSPPSVSVPGLTDARVQVTVTFDTDFAKNGSVQSITPAVKSP